MQDALAPKSSYGASFLLTGRGVFGLGRLQLQELVLNFYRGLSWQGWLHLKIEQLDTLFWPDANPFTASFGAGGSQLDCLRVAEFFCTLPALGIAPTMLAVRAMLPRGRQSTQSLKGTEGEMTSDLRLFALICLALLPMLAVPFNDPFIVNHFPYTMLLGILAGGLTLISEPPDAWSRCAIILQVANLGLVWFFGAWVTWHFRFGLW
jgi:hypothetical protein